MNVALLGTGLLGQAVADRLHSTGHRLTAYNRSHEKTRLLQQRGVRIAATAEEAMSDAKVVLLVLADAAAIRSVLFNHATTAAIQGRTLIQMGTIGPAESRVLQAVNLRRHAMTFIKIFDRNIVQRRACT